MFKLVILNLSASCMLHALTKASSSSETDICFQSFLSIFFQRVAYQDLEKSAEQMWGKIQPNVGSQYIIQIFLCFTPDPWGDDPTTNELGFVTSTTNDNEKHQDEDDVKKKGSFQALMLRLGWVIESCFFLFLEGLDSILKNHDWKTLCIDWWLVVSSFMVHLKIWGLMISCFQFDSWFTWIFFGPCIFLFLWDLVPRIFGGRVVIFC